MCIKKTLLCVCLLFSFSSLHAFHFNPRHPSVVAKTLPPSTSDWNTFLNAYLMNYLTNQNEAGLLSIINTNPKIPTHIQIGQTPYSLVTFDSFWKAGLQGGTHFTLWNVGGTPQSALVNITYNQSGSTNISLIGVVASFTGTYWYITSISVPSI